MANSIWQQFLGSEVLLLQGKTYRSRVVHAGVGHPEALIMTHAGGGHVEAFAPNIVPLGEHLHAIGVEMLWHGYSDAPAIGPNRIEQEGQQILDVLDSFGLESAWIHGMASGGVVPTWLVLNFPERVKGIIYQATTGGFPVEGGQSGSATVGGLSLREHMLRLLREPTREGVRERLLHTVHPENASLITDELIDVRLSLYGRQETNAALTAYYNSQSGFQVQESDFARLNVPTLILSNDSNADSMQRFAAKLPNAQVKTLSKTGLWSNWEAPAEFNDAVLDFIRSAMRREG